jgi:hypothetical protein
MGNYTNQYEFVFIYGLIDPRTDLIRYVGFAVDMKDRLKSHMRDCKSIRTHKTNWLNQLLKLRLKPIVFILDKVPYDDWSLCESAWIVYGLEQGWPLTNMTLGGEGTLGRNHTEEARSKMRGRKSSEHTKKLISENHADVSADNNPRAIINKIDVLLIRGLYGTYQYTYNELALIFGISKRQISKIIRGEAWSSVQFRVLSKYRRSERISG